jgi:hypothetical protein
LFTELENEEDGTFRDRRLVRLQCEEAIKAVRRMIQAERYQ